MNSTVLSPAENRLPGNLPVHNRKENNGKTPVIRLMRLWWAGKGKPQPEMLNAPYPGEPAGTSSSARRALWVQKLNCSSLYNKACKNGLHNTNVLFLPLTLALSAIVTVTEGFILFNACCAGNFYYVFQSLIIMLTIYGLTAWTLRTNGLFEKRIQFLSLINSSGWDYIFMNTTAKAEREGCCLCPELKGLYMFLCKATRNKNRIPDLSSEDIVQMIQLLETMDNIVKSSFTGTEIGITGENSEMMGRIIERIAGISMETMVKQVRNPQKALL